jgi:hypothetical protein
MPWSSIPRADTLLRLSNAMDVMADLLREDEADDDEGPGNLERSDG